MTDEPERTPGGPERAGADRSDAGTGPTHRRVDRWRVGLVAALALVGLGFLFAAPLLLATAVVPLAYVAYGAASSVPREASVSVERCFDDPTPRPGQRVSVALTVENVGESVLPDLRIVDDVPDELAVVAGSPRRAVALRPGDSATVTYEVVARRGEFAFDPPAVRLRSLSAARSLTDSVPAAGDRTLACAAPLSDVELTDATVSHAGSHPTDDGGEGLEFRSTREYKPGDPLTRIHWRQYAKTNELTTVSFREERGVRTVLLVDARPRCRVTPRPGSPTATELAGYAAERLYGALSDGDVITSVAAVGLADASDPVPRGPGAIPWADGRADDADALARRVFAAVQRADDDEPPRRRAPGRDDGSDRQEPAAGRDDGSAAVEAPAPSTDGGSDRTRAVLAGLPSSARVIMTTPMTDDWPVSLVRALAARGYPVTVVSPDVTDTGSLGGAVVGMERARRLREAAATGADVVDWNPAEPIDATLAESLSALRTTDT